MNKVNFNIMQANQTVEGAVAVINISEEKMSKTNNPYVTLTLKGEVGSSAVVTIFSRRAEIKITAPTVIKGKFTKDRNGYVNMVSELEPVSDMKVSDFIKVAPVSPEECFNTIMSVFNSLNYKSDEITLYDVVIKLFNMYKEKILTHPASECTHHNYVSGLIYHMMKMTKIAYFICTLNEYNIDKEVVMCATTLSVINKIFTISVDEEKNGKTNMYYYAYNNGEVNADIVQDAIRKLSAETGKKVNEKRELNLMICLKSYRGKCTWGSSVACITEESVLCSMIHQLDATLDVYEDRRASLNEYEMSEYDKFIKAGRVLNL